MKAGRLARAAAFALCFVPLCAAVPVCAEAKTYEVVIEAMRFDPPTLTVHPGDRIVWINRDLFAHTASSATHAFDSHNIAPQASWSYVVREAGRYPYTCTLHPTMHGTLIVQ